MSATCCSCSCTRTPRRTTPRSAPAARAGFRRLWSVVEQLTGLGVEDVRAFFAQGMLLNVLAAVDAAALDEAWAKACQPDPALFFADRREP